jgi:hypothetical protein
MATQQEAAAKKVQAVVNAPVVSEDPKSPEQIMMRDAKQLEIQTDTDTKYDAVVERFMAEYTPTPISSPLLGVVVAVGLISLSLMFVKSKKK